MGAGRQQIFLVLIAEKQKVLYSVNRCRRKRRVEAVYTCILLYLMMSRRFIRQSSYQGAVVNGFFRFYGYRTPSVSKWLYRQRGSKDKKLGVTRTSEVAQAKRNKQGCRKDTYPSPLGDDRQAGENWLYRDSRGGRLGWPIDRVKTGQSTLIKSRWQSNTQQPGEGGSTGKRA